MEITNKHPLLKYKDIFIQQFEYKKKKQSDISRELNIPIITISNYYKNIKKSITQDDINRAKHLYLIIKCRCGKEHSIYKAYDTFNCSCGRNLIVYCLVNHLNSKVLFQNEDYINHLLAGILD